MFLGNLIFALTARTLRGNRLYQGWVSFRESTTCKHGKRALSDRQFKLILLVVFYKCSKEQHSATLLTGKESRPLCFLGKY